MSSTHAAARAGLLPLLLLAGTAPILLSLALDVREQERRRDDDAVTHALDQLRGRASAVDNLALSARFKLLAHYDPLVKAIDGLRADARELRSRLPADADVAPALGELITALDERMWSLERLKARRAVLRNSESYLARALADGRAETADAMNPLLPELVAFLLEADAERRGRLKQLGARLEREGAPELGRHVQVLVDARHDLDEATREYLRSDLANRASRVAATHSESVRARSDESARIRTWLLAGGLILLVFGVSGPLLARRRD
jgi:hypothetical protein